MSKLSPVELVELVSLYNFPDRETAVAVILGESGGDPSATNREPGNVDRGLWQISSKWHPEVSDEAAYDVQRSTEAALRISSGGTDFTPWHATRHPNWSTHLRTAQQAIAEYEGSGGKRGGSVGSGGGGGSSGSWGGDDRPWWQKVPIVPGTGLDVGDVVGAGGSVVGAVTGTVSGVGDVLGYLGKALSLLTSADFWKRAAWALGGLVLLVLGFQLVFGRDLVAGAVAARTGGAVDLSDDDDE